MSDGIKNTNGTDNNRKRILLIEISTIATTNEERKS